VQEGAGPRPFDAATRHLIEGDPASWLAWVGLPVNGPIQPIDSDLSTVLAEVDKVLRVDAPTPWLAHQELQSGRDPRLPYRLLQYHALLLYRHGLPVESTIVLLRPAADGPDLTGLLEQPGAFDYQTVAFRYRVVRLWQRPVDELLTGGLGTLPLAPLAAFEPDRLPEVMQRLDERLEREAPPEDIRQLWAATLLLFGLRYDATVAQQLARGVRRMRESSVYQAILEEGRESGMLLGRETGRRLGLEEGVARGSAEEARRILLRLGTRKFGGPDAPTAATLARLSDRETLEELIDGILNATSWPELLAPLADR